MKSWSGIIFSLNTAGFVKSAKSFIFWELLEFKSLIPSLFGLKSMTSLNSNFCPEKGLVKDGISVYGVFPVPE